MDLMNFIFNSETLWLLLALFSIALIAGFIDSIAGGGGLITIPALLALSGLTPAEALATNKLQAVGGSFSASLYFVRKKTIDLWQCKFLILTTFIGAIIGASLVRFLSKEVLETLLPILIIVVGCYFLFSPKIGEKDQKPRLSYAFMGLITALIGFYDGFFGPATGSFFTLAFVTLIGFNLISATAHAKVMNFTSNFGSLLFFAFTGNIVWHIGLIMLLGQVIGATFGARMVISKGHKLIRPMLVIVSFSISVKLLYNNYAHFFFKLITS